MAGALLQQNMSALMSALGKSRADSLKGEEAPDSSAAGALGKEEEALLGEEAARKERKKAKANLDGQPRRRRRRRSRRDFSTDDDTHEDLEDASDDYFEDSPPPKVARPRPPGLRPTVLPAGTTFTQQSAQQLARVQIVTVTECLAEDHAACMPTQRPPGLHSSLHLRGTGKCELHSEPLVRRIQRHLRGEAAGDQRHEDQRHGCCCRGSCCPGGYGAVPSAILAGAAR